MNFIINLKYTLNTFFVYTQQSFSYVLSLNISWLILTFKALVDLMLNIVYVVSVCRIGKIQFPL